MEKYEEPAYLSDELTISTKFDFAIKTIESENTNIKAKIKIIRVIIRTFPETLKISDNDGNTLLHLAVINNKPKIVKLLLSNFADTFIKNKDGKSPRKLAKNEELDEIKDLIIRHREEIEKFHDLFETCAEELDEEKFSATIEEFKELFHDYPYMIKYSDPISGNNSLHNAVITGKIELVKFILGLKINNYCLDPLEKNQNDQTPIGLAHEMSENMDQSLYLKIALLMVKNGGKNK